LSFEARSRQDECPAKKGPTMPPAKQCWQGGVFGNLLTQFSLRRLKTKKEGVL
jgi:hypothetical protein